MTGSNGANRVSGSISEESEMMSHSERDTLKQDTPSRQPIMTISFGEKLQGRVEYMGIGEENLFVSLVVALVLLNAIVTSCILKFYGDQLAGKQWVGWAIQDLGNGRKVGIPLYLDKAEVKNYENQK